MNEFIETIRTNLDRAGKLTEVLLNALSLFFIVAGVFMSFFRSIQERYHVPAIHPLHTYFRMLFGGWLVVALEFQLAADIVGTIISPTTEHLVELGAIAIIRTFLNYFLSKELMEEREFIRKESALSNTRIETKSG
jgi:uncharacterized membrane protein